MMNNKERDYNFMSIAFSQAEIAFSKGQLPIGAVLAIDDRFVATNGNSQVSANGWASHAENILIINRQEEIKRAVKDSKLVEIFSTLEPCLQCFGTIVHNRINRVIYACPDPSAGSTHISPPTEWYSNKWPEIVKGPFARESYDLFVRFMRQSPETWKNVLPLYEKISETL